MLRHRSHEERPSCTSFATHAVFTELFVSGADALTPPASASEPFLRARFPPSTGQCNEHREPCRPAGCLPILLQASSFSSARKDGATHRVVSSSSQRVIALSMAPHIVLRVVSSSSSQHYA
ncbi:hypothetical protein TKK_0009547 [Trichogramma kaykai]